MGEEIARATGGRLKIKQYPSGQLGAEDDSIGLARFGAVDFARVNFAAVNNLVPQTRVLCLPFAIDSMEHLHRVVDSDVGAEIRAAFDRVGLVGLAIYDAGARCFYNVRRPIHEPGDLRGLKIRSPMSDVFLRAFAAMGANPTPLAVNGVFQALSTHLIDGAENNWPTFESARHLEMAQFWSETQHSYSPEILTMSKERFLGAVEAGPGYRGRRGAAIRAAHARALGKVFRGKQGQGAGGRRQGERSGPWGVPRDGAAT